MHASQASWRPVGLAGHAVDDRKGVGRTALDRVEAVDQRSQGALQQQIVSVEEHHVRRLDPREPCVTRGAGGVAEREAYDLDVPERRQRHLRRVVDHYQLQCHRLAPDAVNGLQEGLARVRIPDRDHDCNARYGRPGAQPSLRSRGPMPAKRSSTANAADVVYGLSSASLSPVAAMRVLVLTPYPYGTAPARARALNCGSRCCGKPTSSSTMRCSRPTVCTRSSISRDEPGEKAAEMARSYVRQLGRIGRAADYDAVLVNREASLIGPAVIERLVAQPW